jgi:hypothetical protein
MTRRYRSLGRLLGAAILTAMVVPVVVLVGSVPPAHATEPKLPDPPLWHPQAFGINVGTQLSEGGKVFNIITHPGGANVDLVIYHSPGVSKLNQVWTIETNGSFTPPSANPISQNASFNLVGLVPLGHLPAGPSVTSWDLRGPGGARLSPGLYFVGETVLTAAGAPDGIPGPPPWALEIDPGGAIATAQSVPDVRPLRLGSNGQVEIVGNFSPTPLSSSGSTSGIQWWGALFAGLGGLVLGMVAISVASRRRVRTAT